MKFIHNQTGQIFNSEWELRMAHPNTSFPTPFDANALEYANVSVVVEVTQPTVTELQRADYEGIQFVNGTWIEVWSVHPKYDDPVEQANWELECLEVQWDMVRGQRDALLAATDYTDLPNTPITNECRAEFISYRQELRDITETQTDPYNIIWPTLPTYISV